MSLSTAFWILIILTILSGASAVLVSGGNKIQVSSPFKAYWPFGDLWRQYVSEGDQEVFRRVRQRTWLFLALLLASLTVHGIERSQERARFYQTLRKVDLENKASYGSIVTRYNALPASNKNAK